MTKLTLKSTLSATTQAKLKALTVETLKPQDKIASLNKLKTPRNLGLPSKKGLSAPQPATQPKAQGQQPQAQDQEPHQRRTRTWAEQRAFKERIQAAQHWLCETYPAVFAVDHPKPLKMRISADLVPKRPASISYHQLKDTLGAWTRRRVYLQSFIDHDQRYDLDGQPVADILPEHKDYARQQLEDKQAWFEAQQQRRANDQTKRKLSREKRDKPVDNSSEKEES